MKSTWSTRDGFFIQTCQGSAVLTGWSTAPRTRSRYFTKSTTDMSPRSIDSLPTITRTMFLCARASSMPFWISSSLCSRRWSSQMPSVTFRPRSSASSGTSAIVPSTS